MSQGIKMFTNEFIEKSKSVHGDKYDYSKVNYVNTSTKVEIICKEHGVFLQAPSKHLRKQGCVICGGKIIKTRDEIINKFQIIHKNNYDYSLVEYIGNKKVVKIVCKEHGIFEQRVDHHQSGQGCDKCRIDKLKINKNLFLNRLEEIFPKHYSHDFEYFDFQQEIELNCLKTKELFKVIPKKFLLLKNCPCCVENKKKNKIELLKNKPRGLTTLLTQDEFLKKVKKVHNDMYDYNNTFYIKHKEKINVLCKKENHGVFSLSANHHLRGIGCPKCSISKGENKIMDFLLKNDIKHKIQKKFDKCINYSSLRFDFYLPDYNMCIEYDGKQHFEPIEWFGGIKGFEKNVKRDEIKNNFCKENNILLLRIPYWEYENIELILNDKLSI